MRRFIILLCLLLILMIGGIFALKTLQPSTYSSLMLKFDLAADSKEEVARINRINLLPISSEKKEILTNRTIFLGATTGMTELALGTPIQVYEYPDHTPRVDRWVYYFADDSRPTVLEFQDRKLTSAYKVSAHKLNLNPLEASEATDEAPASEAPAPASQ